MYITGKNNLLCWFNNSFFMLLVVGLPARPKSPLDPKKDGESISYSVLPLSDGPEGSTNSRPQVNVIKKKVGKILQNSNFKIDYLLILDYAGSVKIVIINLMPCFPNVQKFSHQNTW